jgi:AraC family transcriptional regulator
MAPLSRTDAEYVTRINRVLDHIDRHLDAELDLSTLAAVAHFSPFHFHRIFAAWMNESLGDYLRRRRLEVAAARLWVEPDAVVLNVALSVGFGSGEAFARAFKKQFGVTPSQWQARGPHDHAQALYGQWRETPQLVLNSKIDQALGKNDQAPNGADADDAGSHPSTRSPSMNPPLQDVRIIQRDPARIAYLRHIGPYGAGVGQFWAQRFAPFMQTHGLAGNPRYGIGHDDPSITAPEKCRYDACVEVADDFQPSASNPADRGVVITSLPGGRCVSGRFQGTPDTIGAAWMWLLRTWLPQNGLIPAGPEGGPCFEYYPPNARYDANTGAFECDLCIPVA